MKRIHPLFYLLGLFFPILAFADTISFTPPTTDYSVMFLSNIFGVVDGVLHGTGSQIMGAIFEVFNAAVMALGGMIITYTMIISTMNTAHEGEMLGKKWNSIWVPVRATAGFALLIPKASGYCLLQIFVMWIVVQGVGAADKLWSAALNYLNRGGVIIQAQQNPTKSIFNTNGQAVTNGAATILSGQVCMIAVQKILADKLQEYKASNVCTTATSAAATSLNPTPLGLFCQSSTVPDFANTVDIVGSQQNAAEQLSFAVSIVMAFGADSAKMPPSPSVPMPNFDASEPLFSRFNGICGHIKWDWPSANDIQTFKLAGLNEADVKTAVQSRLVAISQMYSDLLPTARLIVDNDTLISKNANMNAVAPQGTSETISLPSSNSQTTPKLPTPTTAVEEFGVPLYSSGTFVTGTACASGSSQCTSWGPSPTSTGSTGVLLSGTELQTAMLDYYGVMKPTLTLLAQGQANNGANAERQFIKESKEQGWLMAGSYFFNLVALNNMNTTGSGVNDSKSGLESSTFDLAKLSDSFVAGSSPPACQDKSYFVWCALMKGDTKPNETIFRLFNGTTSATPAAFSVPTTPASSITPASSENESTVFGYLQNALVIQLPGQQGQAPLAFDSSMQVKFSHQNLSLPTASFPCGGISFIFFHICIGEILGNIIYNAIMVNIMNFFAGFLLSMVEELVMAIVTIPLQAFATIFKQAVSILSVPGINPIIALANMGTYYINFVGNLWLQLLIPTMIKQILSMIGIVLSPIWALGMPLVMSWALVMLGVGFITAYYVPIIPYMIFLFGSIAWFMAVIEAIVAAPIVALGVVHPEGHDAFGKGEAAIMILMNVFLRPSMMIIGYIAAISLSYVAVWLLNAGFDNAIGFMQGSSQFGTSSKTSSSVSMSGTEWTPTGEQLGSSISGMAQGVGNVLKGAGQETEGGLVTGGASLPYAVTGIDVGAPFREQGKSTIAEGKAQVHNAGYEIGKTIRQEFTISPISAPGVGDVEGGYTGWAGIFAYFFSVLIYTVIYLQVVEQAFSLITMLPDKVLRWIGGTPEGAGQEAQRMAQQVQGKVEAGGKASEGPMAQFGKEAAPHVTPGLPEKGDASSQGGSSP